MKIAPKTLLGLVIACVVGMAIGAVLTYLVLTRRYLRIESFSVDTTQVLIGEKVTFTWNVTGASDVAFRFVHLPTGSHGDLWEYVVPDVKAANLPPAGQWSYTVPSDLIDRRFKFEVEGADEAGNKVAARSGEITVQYRPCLDGTGECATPPTSTQALMQAFEHGFMLWREDEKRVYVLTRDLAPDKPHMVIGWQAFDDTWAPDQHFELAGEPPTGLLLPHPRFVKILAQYRDLRGDLGWATALETFFDATSQLTRNQCGAYCGQTMLIQLGDGRILRLSAASEPDFRQGYVWQMTPAS
jgi:hypothetical protein